MPDQRGERRNVVEDDHDGSVQRARCGKNCLRSIEIGSGASQPPREASMSDAMRLSRRMER